MNPLQQFEVFYKGPLQERIDFLEKERLTFVKKLKTNIAWMVAIAVVLLLLLLLANSATPLFVLVLILAIIAIVGYYSYQIYNFKPQFVLKFKNEMISAMVKDIDKNLQYNIKAGIHPKDFLSSTLFQEKIDKYHSEDMVFGKVGETQIRFSEVRAQREVKSDKSTHYVSVFNGLFFIADFNKNLKTTTVVLPDFAESMFGSLGSFFQKMSLSRSNLVKLEDPNFEREFVVYSYDPVEARYILSPSFMERIMLIRRRFQCDIAISFVNSRVYVAIYMDENSNLFEPEVFSSVKDLQMLRDYYMYIATAKGIVEDFSLNTRIWGKN